MHGQANVDSSQWVPVVCRGGVRSLQGQREAEISFVSSASTNKPRDGHRVEPYLAHMGARVSSVGYDRVVERRRAVALARHYREFEGLSIRQIAGRLGRSPATVKAYF
jgi:DNA-binding NarL/FixJ family response regulator